MEYIAFIEKDTLFFKGYHYNGETFICFLQWTGNEEMLTKLEKFISSTDLSTEYNEEYPTFVININNKLSESTVNEMMKLNCNSFIKLNGKFNYSVLENESTIEMDPIIKIQTIYKDFNYCRIKNYFK